MKIGILSRKASLYSTSRLVEAAEERGHEVQVVDYLRCYMNITSHRPTVIYGGKTLSFDAIIPRIGASHTFYGTAVVRQFEMMGVLPGERVAGDHALARQAALPAAAVAGRHRPAGHRASPTRPRTSTA